jgi:hypothetical protein
MENRNTTVRDAVYSLRSGARQTGQNMDWKVSLLIQRRKPPVRPKKTLLSFGNVKGVQITTGCKMQELFTGIIAGSILITIIQWPAVQSS